MEKSYVKKPSILKSIFNKDFVISAIIPVVIFTIFSKINMQLNGIIISGLWSIGVVIVNFAKQHEINALAAMAAVFSGVGLVVTIISKNPTFYLISPIVQDILYALIFFWSLFWKRSFIQIIVEQSYLKNAPEELKKKPKYKSAWRILTISWIILNISQAALRVVLLYTVSMSSYYTISTFYANISSPLLLIFCITFPKRYWKNRN
ncbi:hypothetical protein HBE96_14005 [Clostridium sp. P21]|uniref:Intracellular septation protein A n=1 Tax=Clostridium muellerianum TaxID=2716538 RepID=A0A7Y0HQ58_9CLOT|nr:VC0807 family protein [Clostridium muellerianum]NMM63766.1 hypothetical protein [Clostridium muellerianum]